MSDNRYSSHIYSFVGTLTFNNCLSVSKCYQEMCVCAIHSLFEIKNVIFEGFMETIDLSEVCGNTPRILSTGLVSYRLQDECACACVCVCGRVYVCVSECVCHKQCVLSSIVSQI